MWYSMKKHETMKVASKLVWWTVVAAFLAAEVSGDFAYGVNNPETGDEKAHRQISTPDGRTEGEYRWLQPNGLYRVTRYYVDGDSGFRAFVSEEPGEPIDNFYTNTFHHQYPGNFIPSHINDNVESHGNTKFLNKPFSGGSSNKVLPDVVVVGENEQLRSNIFTPPQRFKRTSPPIFNPFAGSFSQSSAGGSGGQSFSRSSSSSFGSSSSSQSGSRAKSGGSGGSSFSGSFSSSSASNFGSSSSSESFSTSGNFPIFFRTKRSPEAKPFEVQSFSHASSSGGGGFGAQSSSGSFAGIPGFGGDGFGASSFSKASAGGFGSGFGAQSSSGSFARIPGFGGDGFGASSFSKASAGGSGSGFGAQSSSGSFAGIPGFGGNGFGASSFSQASAGGPGNGFGAQSSSGSFAGIPGFSG